MEKLKPCPFCGSEKITYLTRIATWLCIQCEAEGPEGPDKEAALAAWNTRAAVPTDEEVEKWLLKHAPWVFRQPVGLREELDIVYAFTAWLRERSR